MYTPLLLLPLIGSALGHTIPRTHRAAPRADHDAIIERNYPKAHFGLPPHNPDTIQGSAGFKREESNASNGNMRKVRRKKRACAVQKPALVALPSSAAAVPSSTQIAAAAVWDDSTHGVPAASSTTIVSSAAASASSSAAPVWDDSTHGVPAAASTSAGPSAATALSFAATSPSSGGLTGLLASLFPRGEGQADWTTATEASHALSFDAALKPLAAGRLPSSGTAPDGSTALVANYPANSVKLASPGHGYSFYTAGAHDGVVVDGAKEVTFSYSVFFQEGFQFVKGGKLPGLYGGINAETAKSCSGGRQDGRDDCFSARLMWRANGAGEIYNYLPTAAYSNADYCNYPPYSLCDAKFGESIGRGAFTFPTGQWTTVAIRLKLNDAGQSNGEQELFVNGKSVIKLDNLLIAANGATKIYGIMAQTFFGGSDSSWASPVDQSAWFKDWSLAVLS